MNATILSVDYAPADLYDQVPFSATLLRQMPGPDRDDYWLARLEEPLTWLHDGESTTVRHIILISRYAGQTITNHVGRIVVGLSYVIDEAQIELPSVDMEKSAYVAIGEIDIVR